MGVESKSGDRTGHDGEPVSAAPQMIRAVVDVGGAETEYLRVGGGEPVVVVAAAEAAHDLPHALGALLAPYFRVIIPRLDGQARQRAGGTYPVWLRDFLDGLGLPGVAVVAIGVFAIPTLEFAMLDPERVRRVALLYHDSQSEATVASIDVLERSGHALLVLRLPAAGTGRDALPALLRFLSGDASGDVSGPLSGAAHGADQAEVSTDAAGDSTGLTARGPDRPGSSASRAPGN